VATRAAKGEAGLRGMGKKEGPEGKKIDTKIVHEKNLSKRPGNGWYLKRPRTGLR